VGTALVLTRKVDLEQCCDLAADCEESVGSGRDRGTATSVEPSVHSPQRSSAYRQPAATPALRVSPAEHVIVTCINRTTNHQGNNLTKFRQNMLITPHHNQYILITKYQATKYGSFRQCNNLIFIVASMISAPKTSSLARKDMPPLHLPLVASRLLFFNNLHH